MNESHWTLADSFKNDFIKSVENAVKNDLQNFRRDPHIGLVIENSTWAGALEDIAYINKYHDMVWSWADKFRTSDSIGNPETFDFPNVGIFSPTTIRYIKALGDLIENFGSLNNFRIAEIGPGYGGFCKIIHDVFRPASYTTFDIAPCLQLQYKFLEHFDIFPYKGDADVQNSHGFDLVIAVCSFSELSMEARMQYIDNVIRYCKRAYFILNYNTRDNIELIMKSLTVALSFVPHFVLHDQNPTILMFK